MAVILGPVNGMLADASSPDYANVQAVVARAETVTGAVEALGVLDTQTEEVVAEARAVLQALPAAVDEAVMAALENAFARGLPVVLAWVQADDRDHRRPYLRGARWRQRRNPRTPRLSRSTR